ncbi:MAG: alpha-hydroxy-acid oxidizing protein [Opitutaceae bacterium]|nr:alpha-hydroxy-acid oxidizing protein [Opitutaceae bacterium]
MPPSRPVPPLDRRAFVRAAAALGALALAPRGLAAAAASPAPDLLTLDEAEAAARAKLDAAAYAYVSGGAGEERTLRWNRERFDDLRFRQRVLRDLGDLDISVTLLGRKRPMPVLFAPTASNRIAHPEGELAVARGAGATGTTYVLSTGATTSIEDVMRAATEPVWFQLYVQTDWKFTEDLVRRAEAAGAEALCLTVDAPVPGARTRSERAGYVLPPGLTVPMLQGVSRPDSVTTLDEVTPARLVWRDVERLIAFSRRPVFLKGILDPADADRAVRAGAAGVIVSNHGGRNLDTLPATIEALPAVADAVAGRVPVLMDGGIRRGTDIVKAVACGATAVLIGRPYLYGLAAAGEAGVAHIQRILRKELRMALALLGVPRLSAVDRGVLWEPRRGG